MNYMNRYIDHIFESTYIDEFFILYELAPDSLKKLLDKTKNIEQSKIWHPEGQLFIHIKLVTNRLHNTYRDINLTLAGLFHDLGKIDTTKIDSDTGNASAHGHEDVSGEIVDQYKNWIKERDGNYDIIKYIVINHMRYKHMNEMRLQTLINFVDNPYFDYVHKFSTADFGGTDLECKDLSNNINLFKKIEQAKKIQEENKIISNKFNGNLVMIQHPELKGVTLGKAISDFKKQSDDFKQYVLNTSSEDIMVDFNNFLNK